jgi:hypothetical protein
VYQVIPDRGQQDGYISRNGYRLSYDTYDLQEDPNLPNAWHGHIIPGIEILHGHKLVNIGYFNQKTQVRANLFAHPVQVYHFYYPTLMQDTLAGVPVRRDYCLISVYDTDTNRDSVIDARDLRRLYHLSLPTLTQTLLVPADYAVLSSQYYPQTDQLLVYARHDANGNGRREPDEPVHVFALDMKRPQAGVRVY